MITTREKAESQPLPPLPIQLVKVILLCIVLFGSIAGIMKLFGL
jgi:hypothetical protein